MKEVGHVSCAWNRRLVIIASIMTAFFLLSCGKNIYHYNNVQYDSADTALEAQKKDINMIIGSLSPTKTPVGGSLVAILPSKEHLEKNFIIWKKSEVSEEEKKQASQYLSLLMMNSVRSRIDALERRRIFGEVVITYGDDPEHTAFDADFAVVVLQRDGKAKWFLRKRSKMDLLIPLEEMSSALPPVQATNVWLDSVEKTVREAQNTP